MLVPYIRNTEITNRNLMMLPRHSSSFLRMYTPNPCIYQEFAQYRVVKSKNHFVYRGHSYMHFTRSEGVQLLSASNF